MAKKKKGKRTSIALSVDSKWQAEEDLRTLQRASEIEADSKRVKAAKKVAKDQMDALRKVTIKGK